MTKSKKMLKRWFHSLNGRTICTVFCTKFFCSLRWKVYVFWDRKKCIQVNNLLGIIMGVQIKLSLRSSGKDLFRNTFESPRYKLWAEINAQWASRIYVFSSKKHGYAIRVSRIATFEANVIFIRTRVREREKEKKIPKKVNGAEIQIKRI